MLPRRKDRAHALIAGDRKPSGPLAFLSTVLLFTALGPPIGLVAYSVLPVVDALWNGRTPPTAADYLSLLLRSHVIGGIPAFLVGLGVAGIALGRGSAPLWQALAWTGTVLVVLLAVSVVIWRLNVPPSPYDLPGAEFEDMGTMLFYYSVASFPATAVCWLIGRRLKLV